MIFVQYKVPFKGKQCTINDCSLLREGGIYRFVVDQVSLVYSMQRKDGPSIFCGGICRECMVICHEDRFRTYRLILGLKMMRVFSTIGIGLLEFLRQRELTLMILFFENYLRKIDLTYLKLVCQLSKVLRCERRLWCQNVNDIPTSVVDCTMILLFH